MTVTSQKPIVIIACLFFIFGFVTWLNGALIPIFKIACELTNFESLLVAFSFYISYFVMALPSGWVLNKIGFKKGMSLGLFVMAFGMLFFVPAAYTREYVMFLVALFVIGSGLALLQTAANPYVAIVGPPESAAQRISMMGVANKVAGVISPLLLSALVWADSEDLLRQISMLDAAERAQWLNHITLKLIPPYLGMAIILALLSFLIIKVDLPNVMPEEKANDLANGDDREKTIFNYPHLWLGVLALFFAVGVEVIAGDTVISYAMDKSLPMPIAQIFTSITLACMVVGYLLGIICIPRYVTQEVALGYAAMLGVFFTAVALLAQGWVSVAAIAGLGVANALLWPAIWPLSIKNLGKHTSTGASLLIMAIAGGAILPLLYGYFSDVFNSQIAYVVLLPMYGFILFFARQGHKLKKY